MDIVRSGKIMLLFPPAWFFVVIGFPLAAQGKETWLLFIIKSAFPLIAFAPFYLIGLTTCIVFCYEAVHTKDIVNASFWCRASKIVHFITFTCVSLIVLFFPKTELNYDGTAGFIVGLGIYYLILTGFMNLCCVYLLIRKKKFRIKLIFLALGGFLPVIDIPVSFAVCRLSTPVSNRLKQKTDQLQ